MELDVLDLETVRLAVHGEGTRVLGDRLDEFVGNVHDELHHAINTAPGRTTASTRTPSTSSSMAAPGEMLWRISRIVLRGTMRASSAFCDSFDALAIARA
jgi:hypothetical protein